MSIISNRRVINEFSGDYDFLAVSEAVENDSSPGTVELYALSSGANTITPPTGATGVTILPPAGNTVVITLKGVSGDTGIELSLLDPTSLGLNSTSTFVLNAASAVTIQLIWS